MMATLAQQWIEKGIEKGIERGKVQERETMARRLLKLHDVVTVSELTGLTIEQVKQLQHGQPDESE